jgi:hypothetical protein
MFSYADKHRCVYCDKIIIKNKNMVRVIRNNQNLCFHVICHRKMDETRISVNKYLNRVNRVNRV